MNHRVNESDRGLFIALLLLVVLVPLPYASQRNWAIGLWFLVCTTMLSVRLLQIAISDRGYTRLSVNWRPVALLLLYALLICTQIIGNVSSDAQWPYISHDLHQTRVWLLLTLTYAEVFVLVSILARSRLRLRVLMWTVVVSGTIQAFLAITLVSFKFHGNFLFFDIEHLVAMGSFSGRNIFAAYMELCLSVGVGLLVASMAKRRLASGAQHGVTATLNSFLGFLLSSKLYMRGLLVVMVIALVLTRSRMGNAAFFVSLLIGGICIAVARKELRRVASILVVSMLLIDLLIVGQWVGLDRVVTRLQETPVYRVDTTQELKTANPSNSDRNQGKVVSNVSSIHYEESVEDRTEASRQAVSMIYARPWLGFGAGAFYTSFLSYKKPDLLGFWDHPHNDFVEIAVDTGLLGVLLLSVLCVITAWRAFYAMRDKFDELKFATGLACLLALTCMLIHGSVDFVLQIPANAMLLCIILASVYAGEPDR